MNDAFLPFDVCAKLGEAGMVVGGRHRFWYLYDDVMVLDILANEALDMGELPAVTPLQALDWLVASGRIHDYELNSIAAYGYEDPDNWGPRLMKDRATGKEQFATPTDLVRAILEAA